MKESLKSILDTKDLMAKYNPRLLQLEISELAVPEATNPF
jgi:hypothetical protein